MARASGPAVDNALPGRYYLKSSNTTYAVEIGGGSVSLTYHNVSDPVLDGRRTLLYFLGSGHLGVTYMYMVNGYLLESPIAYYSNLAGYDLKPGLSADSGIPAALPMSPRCMRCHMSGVQPADPGTLNHFRGLPFLEGGITCEQCHGNTRKHVSSGGRSPALNPGKLNPDQRDSICIRCHLEGDTSVEHAGRSLANYKPGDRIEEYVTYFVYRGANMADRGVSEVEELNASHCKRASGSAMSCMSCHDPHSTPSAGQRVAFFRSKCLTCHTGTQFATQHHAENPDCTACHMPSGKAQNIPHVAWTDHRILIPSSQVSLTTPDSTAADLVPAIPEEHVSPRDLALGYANLVIDGRRSEMQRAWSDLLVAQAASPNDPEVLVALGYIAQAMGSDSDAATYYRRALESDPSNLSAMNNLGVLLAHRGDLAAAGPLLKEAFRLNEDLESLGLNLAILDCKEGLKEEAQQALKRVLVYSPGSSAALRDLQTIQSSREPCGEAR